MDLVVRRLNRRKEGNVRIKRQPHTKVYSCPATQL